MDPHRTGKRASLSFGSQKKPYGSNYVLSYPYVNNNNITKTDTDSDNNDSRTNSNIINENVENNNNNTLNSMGNVVRSPMYSPLDFGPSLFKPVYQSQNKNPYLTNSNELLNNPNLMNSAVNNNTISSTGIRPTVACQYQSSYPLFGIDWSMDDFVCLSSYKEDSRNKIQIIKSNDLLTWNKVTESDVTYPISNIKWLPSHMHPRQLATSSDSLRIWSLNDEIGTLEEQINLSLCKYKKQTNKLNTGVNTNDKNWSTKILGELPPVTSFDWNSIDTNILVSSSIDTTCIVWDLQSSTYVKTQLIAHDSEVFDVKFLAKSTHLFASCGGDGSVRVFDLRSLAHSTIIYEPPTLNNDMQNVKQQDSALLRLEPSPNDPNVLATFVTESDKILILDMRNPEAPVLTLNGHSSSINQIKWHPTKRNILLSCADDCQVLYWDLNAYLNSGAAPVPSRKKQDLDMFNENIDPNTNSVDNQDNESSSNSNNNGNDNNTFLDTPSQFFANNSQEINNITWRPQRGDWFGLVSGKKFQNVRTN